MYKTGLNFNAIKPFVKERRISTDGKLILHQLLVRSRYLGRKMLVDIYLPQDYHNFKPHFYPALLINDGQDMGQLMLTETISTMVGEGEIPEIVVIAVHAADRMQDYGIAGRPDYMNRGSKADNYTLFITKELVPYVYKHYRCFKSPHDNVIAGFSLGGLSAMDIAWHHPNWFSKVGVFSGSFWWRDKAVHAGDPDAHRIMHNLIDHSTKRESLRFWLQTGTEDEKEDRNNNGVIDSIDDTLDIISSLKNVGYEETDITYMEVAGGQHNFHTWSQIFPEFLRWAFGKKSSALSKKSA